MADEDIKRQSRDVRDALIVTVLVLLGIGAVALFSDAKAEALVGEWKGNIEGFRSNTRLFDDAASLEECQSRLEAIARDDGEERTSGTLHYHCRVILPVNFSKPAPKPTCADVPRPLADTRVQQCPSGYVGTFGQTREYAPNPAQVFPDQCWEPGEQWLPESSDLCIPRDSDNDGVPDSADKCPTVPASTPDGCPATPPPVSVTFEYLDGSQWRALDGATVSGTVSLRVNCASGDRATLYLDGAVYTSNGRCPLSFTGDTRLLADGAHTLEVRGAKTVRASFTVSNARPSEPPQQQPVPPITGNGSATISWVPPTANTDGSALTDLAGYYVYASQSPQALGSRLIGTVSSPATTTFVATDLAPGTWYFAVAAYTTRGATSALSAPATKTIP